MPTNQQMRPASPEQAPDPSFNYERSHPERESPAGTLDNKSIGRATPAAGSDKIAGPVTNAQDPSHSLTAQDASVRGLPTAVEPDHSMADEEPLGWDQSPQGSENPTGKRHPRTGGQGGTPNVGVDPRRS
jgi:hypothetical protein